MKAFDDEEKKFIVQQLLIKGKEIFKQYGIKKTTIRQLVKSVDIATGSFYLFFDSKEELYFQIFTNEIKEEIEKNQEIMTSLTDHPKKMVKFIIGNFINVMENNAILNKLLVWEENTLLQYKFSSRSKEMRDFLIRFVQEWQNMNILIDINTEVLAGSIRALLFLTYHKEGIGDLNYKESLDLLIDSLVNQIVIKKD